ncbi:MAG: hypothetical protein PHS96_05975 [Anaerolineales bacterium]|nr:hypothetical protein [Anaerolineales bacterium]
MERLFGLIVPVALLLAVGVSAPLFYLRQERRRKLEARFNFDPSQRLLVALLLVAALSAGLFLMTFFQILNY